MANHMENEKSSKDEKKKEAFREWRSISDILESRHTEIWQARAIYMISIAAFIGLSSQKLLLPALSLAFVIFLTAFTVLLDCKYQILKQDLYKRAAIREKELGFEIYSKFRSKVDRGSYAILLWLLLIAAIAVWWVVGSIR